MKRVAYYLTAILMLGCVGCAATANGGKPLSGGFTEADPGEASVLKAADFAVRDQLEELQKESSTARLSLVKVMAAEKQVVAGVNYRLSLKVLCNGTEKQAEVIVWWQSWRTPNPYQLTTWTWMCD